ncbi:MAG TPA: competence/damage-inducible protein A [Feifaniaceae bacterium]|nr:competence/damage-inducible protein A [Feifaniaceae bacterium]
MIAELISVGTELLMGQVLNTDAQFMAQKLAPLGVNVYRQVTVGDNPERLKDAVRAALSRADVVILSGGLGPTGDDLTKQTVADLFELPMERDAESERKLHERFAALRREMTPNNLKQADFPKGSIILKNPNGTAPGCIVPKGDKAAILLPGPPSELFPMFEREVMPYLEKRSGWKLYSRELRIFGTGESAVEHRLQDLMDAQDNPTIAPYAKTGEVTLRVTARCATEEEGLKLVQPVIEKIKGRLGDVVYSTEGVTLAGVCAKLLEERSLTLAVAESCTGGLISSTLIDIPGSSAYFMEGAVTYSDAAKMRRLGVSSATLRKYGAVSAECAKEMAMGMRRTSGTDYALATTGIAGPGGATKEKPVGLVYIALSDGKDALVKRLQLTGDRARIREVTVLNALDLLRRSLLGLPQVE